MGASENTEATDGLRDGDVLVYMSGRLLVVDHLVPEAFDIDLVELSEADARMRAEPTPPDPLTRSGMLRSSR